MLNTDIKKQKFDAHAKAVSDHKILLEKLHLDSNIRLDEVNQSFEKIALTLEEYLKVLGIG